MEGNFLSKSKFLRNTTWFFVCAFSSAAHAQPKLKFEFDSSLMPTERRLISRDLELLKNLRQDAFTFENEQNRSRDLQALRNDPASWLTTHVSILVGPLNRPAFIGANPNSTMRNLGAILALDKAKQGSILINSRELKVSTPAIGIIQYMKNPSEILLDDQQKPDALVNRIYRLALMFHDARHSDGAADDLGIPHVACPKGHRFAKQLVCDKYIDASFGVQTFIGSALFSQYQSSLSNDEQKLLTAWISSAALHIVGKEIYGK